GKSKEIDTSCPRASPDSDGIRSAVADLACTELYWLSLPHPYFAAGFTGLCRRCWFSPIRADCGEIRLLRRLRASSNFCPDLLTSHGLPAIPTRAARHYRRTTPARLPPAVCRRRRLMRLLPLLCSRRCGSTKEKERESLTGD
ncbi:hypothetical protein Dimus_029754, partial [Dionaea muscipula]